MRKFKTGLSARLHTGFLVGFGVLATAMAALAFPPAPYHTLYGMVRDEMGEPIMSDNMIVTLETTNGIRISTTAVPNLQPGMNYRLQVPMDAGLTAANYSPMALRPLVSFRMKVTDGDTTYLPMEVKANYANLGKPAQSTRMDLTLGEDSDGDGLPDAWERSLIGMGYGQTLADILPNVDSDGDGLSNLNEYLAGTYAFDPSDGFSLDIAGMQDGRPLLEFMVLPGRSYTVLGSSDLKTWSVLNFRVAAGGPSAPLLNRYPSTEVSILRIQADLPDGKKAMYFKAMVQ
jgi:hypothetical protein